MKELIPTINEIVKYGLEPNLIINKKIRLLEKNLLKMYSLYFEINYVFDENTYEDFDTSQLVHIRQNVESNFKDFGFYKNILEIHNIENLNDHVIGDAIDDLTDIIKDLLEIKWRIENNSVDDGLWFFDFIFTSHTQQHILDLLNYIKQKDK